MDSAHGHCSSNGTHGVLPEPPLHEALHGVAYMRQEMVWPAEGVDVVPSHINTWW